MQNPYEDLIKVIDLILRKIELDPTRRVYLFQGHDFPPLSMGIHELAPFFENLKSRDAIKDFQNLPRYSLSFIINEPNKKLLLKERKRLSNFEESSGKEKTDEKIVLYLSADGDLYREPKNKYCYPLSKERMREKIIRFLIGKNYQPTAIIQNEVGSIDAQSVRLAIGKINSNAKTLLGLRNKLIEGKRDSGYRINPQYKFPK